MPITDPIAIDTGTAREQQIAAALALVIDDLPDLMERLMAMRPVHRREWIARHTKLRRALGVCRIINQYSEGRDADPD